MEDGRTAVKLLNKGCFLTKIDLKDAYFAVQNHVSSRKYLRFQFDNVLYKFQAMPFGLSYAPYVFTKILRPVVSFFRRQGITCVVYIDDWLLISDSMEESLRVTELVSHTLQQLGFTII